MSTHKSRIRPIASIDMSSTGLEQWLLAGYGAPVYSLARDVLPWAFILVTCWSVFKLVRSVDFVLFRANATKVDLTAAIGKMNAALKFNAKMESQPGETFNFDSWKAAYPKPAECTEVPCWDPATLRDLGTVPAMSADAVKERIAVARGAQKSWGKSDFGQRRRLMATLLRCIVENCEPIARAACVDSGKTTVDAMVGEILVTCEKLRWTISSGEEALADEYRWSGVMNLHKTSRVQYSPMGVVGAIVPWNYPFHNLLNPVISALFAGNAIVIKVSEYASWSSIFYLTMIRQCLAAVGAPTDLVQIVTGFGAAGHGLVTGGVDTVIFVGSVGVGKMVMKAAAETLTPVCLELGGKDVFIICDDANPAKLAQLACRGVFQNMGQNCAGPERFLVYSAVYDQFCKGVTDIVNSMQQGSSLDSEFVDCGACCMPQSMSRYQELVDDAVSKGAVVMAGGTLDGMVNQLYPPTVLAGVTEEMMIANEEIFGPIMCIFKIDGASKEGSDAEALRVANESSFGLSGCVHSGSQQRAAAMCNQLESGMASVNDLEGTTYLSQSLPFGGQKDSGFGRFAGPEGLRGLCHVKSVCENRLSFIAAEIPAQLAYPANGQGPAFCKALIDILYGYGLLARLGGVFGIIKTAIGGKKNKTQ